MENGVPFELVRLFARLAQPLERSGAARDLASFLQIEAVLVFVRDPEISAFLLAPGFNRILPGGQAWQKFLVECSDSRRLERLLPFVEKGSLVTVTGLAWKNRAVLVLVGSAPPRLEAMAELLPMLVATLETEHALAIHAAQAGLARDVAQQSTALAQGLDNARRAAQQEITARKSAEKSLNLVGDELKRANAELTLARDKAIRAVGAKDDFLAALSHELRTPLNPVLLVATEAAGNPRLPAPVRAEFEMIAKNIGLEARLIDDLLDLTRISRGKMHFEKEQVVVREVLDDTIKMLRADLVEKKIDLVCEFPSVQTVVLGDSVRLHQIFWNVIKNAVKFTPSGGHIWITNTASRDRRTLTIEVRDSGIGLAEEETEKIFEAFSQGDHATGNGSHRFGGLGLGLAISRALATLHGGRISAVSAGRGQGSTFRIELPYQDVETEREASGEHVDSESLPAVSDISPAKALGARRLSILLVEDHAPSCEAVKNILLRRGHSVHSAGSATEARGLAGRLDFDLVISDLGLPDRDGYQLMGELRDLRPELVGIALSGYGMEEDLARGRAAGFVLYLVKPVRLRELDNAITQLFPRTNLTKRE